MCCILSTTYMSVEMPTGTECPCRVFLMVAMGMKRSEAHVVAHDRSKATSPP